MRIAFITPEFVTEPSFSGGLANYLGRVTAALARAGHVVHVITRSPELGRIQHQGVTVHRVQPCWSYRVLDKLDGLVPRKFRAPYQDVKGAWALWRRWRRLHAGEPFDLVQVANVMGAGLFFRHERVPVVLRMSSYRPAWDVAAGTPVDAALRWRWRIEAWTVRGKRFLYAPSHFVARQVEKAYRTPPVTVVESPFFEEATKLDAAIYQAHCAGKEYFFYFGRLTRMKGVHVLAEALPGLMEHHAGLHAVFVGGDAPAPDGGSMRELLRDRAAVHANRLILLDPLRHEQLYPILDRARLVVLPSLIDNLPNTLLEAMGHGRVVIGTTGSCFEQLIEHGVSGLLVPPGDPQKLAEAISQAWAMPAKQAAAMGAAARVRVAELHPDKAIPRLLAYYQSVIAQHRQGGKPR